jgi:NAD(P)-dependent dehydrogenase (short-subunit alcohol dehydrogenase family)
VATAMGGGSHEQIVPLLQANPALATLYGTLLPSDYRMVADDITPSVIYLASDAARLVTGVTLPIDQGTSAR